MASTVAEAAIRGLADFVLVAVKNVMDSLGTLWVRVDTRNITGNSFEADGALRPSEAVAFIQGSLWWYTAAFAILATIVGGLKMAWEGRAEPGRETLKGLLTLAVVSGAGLTVIWHGMRAADEFSVWIIDRSLQDFTKNFIDTLRASGPLGPLLAIILGLIAIFVSMVQIMLMVARTGALVVLAGVLPCLASFTSTEMGRETFKKATGWILAFILYKPAAAIIYATAFKLTGTKAFGADGQGLLPVLVGLMLMILSLFALPALMKLVVPAVGAVAGGGGGGAGAALAAALPTGAMALAGRRGGGNGTPPSGGGPESQNPSGAGNTSPSPSPPPAPPSPPGSGGGRGGSGSASPGAGGGGGNPQPGPARTGPTAGPGALAAGGAVGAAVAGGAAAVKTSRDAAAGTAQQAAGNPSEGPSGSNK